MTHQLFMTLVEFAALGVLVLVTGAVLVTLAILVYLIRNPFDT